MRSGDGVAWGERRAAPAVDEDLHRLAQVLHLREGARRLGAVHEGLHLLARSLAQRALELLRLAVAVPPVIVVHVVLELRLGPLHLGRGRRVAHDVVVALLGAQAEVAELVAAAAHDPVAAAILLDARVALAAALGVRLHPLARARVTRVLVLPRVELLAPQREVRLPQGVGGSGREWEGGARQGSAPAACV